MALKGIGALRLRTHLEVGGSRDLRVSRIPGSRNNRSLVGPDKFLLLMAAAESQSVGYIDEPLVNFDAHDGSTTIKMTQTEEGRAQIVEDYWRVTKYFDLLVRGDG